MCVCFIFSLPFVEFVVLTSYDCIMTVTYVNISITDVRLYEIYANLLVYPTEL